MIFFFRDTPTELKGLLRARECLDRRRLEEGFLLMAAIETIEKYNLSITDLPCNRNILLETITEQYHNAFVKKWGGGGK